MYRGLAQIMRKNFPFLFAEGNAFWGGIWKRPAAVGIAACFDEKSRPKAGFLKGTIFLTDIDKSCYVTYNSSISLNLMGEKRSME